MVVLLFLCIYLPAHRTCVNGAPLTPYPKWVYEQYDGDCLVERAHHLLGKLKLFSHTYVGIPREPKELSFWLAANLPLDDKHKFKLLEFSCAIRRLRYQISLLEQVPLLIVLRVRKKSLKKCATF